MKNMHKNQHGQHGQSGHNAGFPAADPAPVPEPLVLTDDTIASLRFMIEEEKMAGDLYDAFFDQTGLQVFEKIAASEGRHMDALLKQAELAGIDVSDLIALPAGEYADPALQDLYSDLLMAGSVSSDAALAVGRAVELTDIADLNEALPDVTGTTLVGVYSHLLAGSENHLAAFDFYLA